MRPQRQKCIYIGFDSPTIIRYLEPSTADVFEAKTVEQMPNTFIDIAHGTHLHIFTASVLECWQRLTQLASMTTNSRAK